MSAGPSSIWDVAAELGEGPVWDARDQALWFVDIKKHHIHRIDPAGGRSSWNAPEQIGFLLPAERGGFIAGLQSGLHHFDPTAGTFDLVAHVEAHLPGNRLNDAVVDPQGRLWFGTMDDGEREPSGAFYSFGVGGLQHSGIDGIAITNGPALSPDGSLAYVIDTLAGTIDVAEVLPDGTLGSARPFVRIDPADGHPDGPTVDAEGCVWVGLYAGWEARRYSPKGELLSRIRFPVANITKLAFGGDDLRTVYATTARQLLSPAEIQRQPQAGDLFRFEVEVPGLPCSLVAY